MKPYEWIDDKNRPQGMIIELLDAVSKKAGCEYATVVMKYPEMHEMLKDNQISMLMYSQLLGDYEITSDYMMPVAAIDVYYRYFLSRKDSPEYIDKLDNIYGKTVLVMSGGTSHVFAKSIQEKYALSIIEYDSVEDAVSGLSKGAGDFAFFEAGIIQNILASGKYSNVRVSGDPIMPAVHSLMINKGNVDLYLRLEAAFKELMQNGEYYRIVEKWQGKQNSNSQLFKILGFSFIVVLCLFMIVVVWNKSLYGQVRRKTESLVKSNEENSKLREEAIMNCRLATLGEMAASVAHEINNPTGLIIHNMTFLSRYINELTLEADKFLSPDKKICSFEWNISKSIAHDSEKIINDSLDRVKKTIDDLKDFGRIRNNAYCEIELSGCVLEAVKLTNYFIKQYTNHLTVKLPEHPLYIYGNASLIVSSLINLIQNSCYALFNKNGIIECGIETHQKEVRLYVKDTGKGMSNAVLKQSLNAFFTTRGTTGGTGLGLSITERIVKEHNGRLTILSQENEGTEVSLFFKLLYDGESI